ncbi:MAG TPA: hypothetical protein VLI92_02255 [Candidatus Saccharimonadales bacterium]|nr:hypothetical protein [Candidatus Saccharimonadales bacterium]
MPLSSEGMKKSLLRILPYLHAQPTTEHVENCLEFDEAIEKLQLVVIDHTGHKLVVRYLGEKEPIYEPLWKDSYDRIYIRVIDHISNRLVDVFLLPVGA